MLVSCLASVLLQSCLIKELNLALNRFGRLVSSLRVLCRRLPRASRTLLLLLHQVGISVLLSNLGARNCHSLLTSLKQVVLAVEQRINVHREPNTRRRLLLQPLDGPAAQDLELFAFNIYTVRLSLIHI